MYIVIGNAEHTIRSRGSLGDFWSLIFSPSLLKSPIFSYIGLPKFISRSTNGNACIVQSVNHRLHVVFEYCLRCTCTYTQLVDLSFFTYQNFNLEQSTKFLLP